jgi:hypothetical protein
MIRIAHGIGRVAGALWRAAPEITVDGIGLAGVGLISYGFWLAYPPAGFVSAGSLLLAGVALLARQKSRRESLTFQQGEQRGEA